MLILVLILLFVPVFYSFCPSAPLLSLQSFPIILSTVVLVQCFFSELKYQRFPLRPLSDGDFMSLEKSMLYLIKPKYSNRSCCMLLKSVCWFKGWWPKNVLFAALLASKPSACGRLECVSGECRPKPSPFFKKCCRGEFMLSTQDCWEDVFPSADYQIEFLLRFFNCSPTEAASRAIVQFLEVNQSEEASRGWMLLTTINLLASSGQVSLKQQG